MKKVEMKMVFTITDKDYNENEDFLRLKNAINSGQFQRELKKEKDDFIKDVVITLKVI